MWVLKRRIGSFVLRRNYSDESFDTVVVYNAIGHLSEIIDSILSESLHVLRPGGSVFVISSFKMDKSIIEDKLLPYLEQNGIPYSQTHDTNFTYIQIQQKI